MVNKELQSRQKEISAIGKKIAKLESMNLEFEIAKLDVLRTMAQEMQRSGLRGDLVVLQHKIS